MDAREQDQRRTVSKSTGKTNLVDHQQVRLRDPRSTLSWYLVSTLRAHTTSSIRIAPHLSRKPSDLITYRNINHINNIIRQLPRIIRREVIASALNKEHLAPVARLQTLERTHVRADVLSDRSVWATTRLNSEDARSGQRIVLDEKFLIFSREDVICYRCWCASERKWNRVSG